MRQIQTVDILYNCLKLSKSVNVTEKNKKTDKTKETQPLNSVQIFYWFLDLKKEKKNKLWRTSLGQLVPYSY